jgi:hypothetical protein
MKYRDLVNFEPIETIIQLEQTEKAEEASQLVQTFVISEPMADKLRGGCLICAGPV